MKISGVYKIINKINGKYYIGSSDDIKRRWQHHKSYLTRKCHRNIHLTNAWHKYGQDNFDFLILKEIQKENLIVEEQKYLDEASKETDKCYNQYFTSYKIEWTDERRKRASERVKNIIRKPGKFVSTGIKKAGSFRKVPFRWSEEQKKQMSIQRKLYWHEWHKTSKEPKPTQAPAP